MEATLLFCTYVQFLFLRLVVHIDLASFFHFVINPLAGDLPWLLMGVCLLSSRLVSQGA